MMRKDKHWVFKRGAEDAKSRFIPKPHWYSRRSLQRLYRLGYTSGNGVAIGVSEVSENLGQNNEETEVS